MSDPRPVAFQDECGDLYCPEHAEYAGPERPLTVADVERATVRLRDVFGPEARMPHCDFCGSDLP